MEVETVLLASMTLSLRNINNNAALIGGPQRRWFLRERCGERPSPPTVTEPSIQSKSSHSGSPYVFTYPRLDILVWCTYERVHTWVGMVFSLTKAAGQVLVAITIGDWSFETVLGTLSVYGPNTVG